MAKDNFDDFDDFDKMFDGMDDDIFGATKKRKPLGAFKEGFLSGVKDTLRSKATDSYSQSSFLKEANLKGFANAVNLINESYETANDLYNQASKQLKDPLKGLVKELDSRIPENKTFLKKLSSKAKSFLGVDEDSEYQTKSQEQLEEEGVQSTLESTFGKNTIISEISNNARFQAQFKQSGAGNKLLSSINTGIYGINKYHSTVDVNYKKKSLELQLKTMAIQRKQLEVTSGLLGTIIEQNKAIQLNTSLPDQDKVLESKHTNKHLLTKYAARKGYFLFSNSEYIKNLKNNVSNRFKEHIDNLKYGVEGAQSGLEMTKDMGLSPWMMAGMGLAGFLPIDSVLQYGIAPWLKKKINPNGKLGKANKFLRRYTTDIEGGTNAGIDALQRKLQTSMSDRLSATGFGAAKINLKDLMSDLLGSARASKINMTLEKKDRGDNLFKPVPFNLQTQKSINLIIPGYLSRILQQVTQNNVNNPGLNAKPVSTIDFDHDKNRFIDSKRMAGKAGFRMNQVLQTKYNRKYLNDLVSEHLGASQLAPNQAQILKSGIVKGMLNGNLVSKDYLLSDDFHRELSAEDSKAIKAAVNGSLTNEDKDLKFISKAFDVKSQIGDIRPYVEEMINQGREEDLIKAGFLSRTRSGYKINKTKIISELSKGNGVVKPVRPESPLVSLVRNTNAGVSQKVKGIVEPIKQQVVTTTAPYIERAQSVAEPYIHVVGKTIKSRIAHSDIEDMIKNPLNYKQQTIQYMQNKKDQIKNTIKDIPGDIHNKLLEIEAAYAEIKNNPNDNKYIRTYNKKVKAYKRYINRKKRQYANNPNKLSQLSKLEDYVKPVIETHVAPIINKVKETTGPLIKQIDETTKPLTEKLGIKRNSTIAPVTNIPPVTSENTEDKKKSIFKKSEEETILSVLTKFYNKFKDFSESIVDVRVISNDQLANLDKDGNLKKIRKRKGFLGKALDKATRPFTGITNKFNNITDITKGLGNKVYDKTVGKTMDVLEALKTLLPTETLKKLIKIPFTAGSIAYNGIKGGLQTAKKMAGWVNPLSLVKNTASTAFKMAKTGANAINHIGCAPQDIYTVSDKDGKIKAEPTLTKFGFIKGDYFNADGKPIYSTCDIKGDVYDSNQNVILTMHEIKHLGIYNKHGKRVYTKGLFKRNLGKLPGALWHVGGKLISQAGNVLKLPGKAAAFLAKNAGMFMDSFFKAFGAGAGLVKGGMNLIGNILKPFGHIGKLFRDPYTEKSYHVLMDIKKILLHQNGLNPTGYNHGVSMLNGKIIPGVRTELNDPTKQVFADKWWKHPGSSLKNKLNTTKNSIGNYFKKKPKAKSKSGGGFLSHILGGLGNVGEDAMEGAGGLGILGFAKSKLGSMLKFGKNKIGSIWNWAKSKLGFGADDAAGDAAGDVAGDAAVDVAGDAAADAGAAGGLEAAGAGLDATGVGAPIGVILNVAGGLALLYGLFHKQINQAVSWGWNKLEKGIGWIEKKVGNAASWAAKKLGIDTAVKDVGDAYTDTKDALEDKHHKGYYTKLDHSKKAPLGIKLNNPLYIKYWPVEPNLPKVNGYVKIATAETGLYISAAYIKYYISKGYDTIPKLIVKMDLPGVNKNPKSFILKIANQARISIKTKLNMNDGEVLDRVLTAIIMVQNGSLYYSPALISQACKDMAKQKPLEITNGKAAIPPSVKKALPKTKVSTIKPATTNPESKKSHSRAKVGASSETFGQVMEKGIIGTLTGAIAGIFGLSSSVFKGLGEAGAAIAGGALSAYNGVKYVAGKAEHYAITGIKDLEGDFESVAKLVGIYGISGLTAFLESRGNPAVVSGGQGDYGGRSYGTFQLSSSAGSDGIAGFLGYIQNTPLGKKLINSGAVDSSGFIAMWKKLATTEPQFNQMQASYNKVNYYDPIMRQLAQQGCDLSDKKLGVQCVLDRTANQFGAAGGAGLVLTALHGKDVAKLSSDEVIKLIEDHKLNNINSFFHNCSAQERQGVARELVMEKKFGIKLNGATVTVSKKAVNKAPPKVNKAANVKGKIDHKAIEKKTKAKLKSPIKKPIVKGKIKKPINKSVAKLPTITKEQEAADSVLGKSKVSTITGGIKKTPVTKLPTIAKEQAAANSVLSNRPINTTPVAKLNTSFTSPTRSTTSTPIVMTTNHHDVKGIHSHVVDIHTLLEKSVEIQTKIYEQLKTSKTETNPNRVNKELEAADSVLSNPSNASAGNKNRVPTNIPAAVVTVNRSNLKNKDW